MLRSTKGAKADGKCEMKTKEKSTILSAINDEVYQRSVNAIEKYFEQLNKSRYFEGLHNPDAGTFRELDWKLSYEAFERILQTAAKIIPLDEEHDEYDVWDRACWGAAHIRREADRWEEQSEESEYYPYQGVLRVLEVARDWYRERHA